MSAPYAILSARIQGRALSLHKGEKDEKGIRKDCSILFCSRSRIRCLPFVCGLYPGTDNSGGNGGTGEHVHSYTEQSVPATCQKKAHTLYVCSCGDSYEDDFTGELAAHTGSVKCSVCGINYYETLAGTFKRKESLTKRSTSSIFRRAKASCWRSIPLLPARQR